MSWCRNCASTPSPIRTMRDRGSGVSFRLQYVGIPSTPDGDQYYLATWTGISGDVFYRNASGADFTTFSGDWFAANIRSKGPLMAASRPSRQRPLAPRIVDTPSSRQPESLLARGAGRT